MGRLWDRFSSLSLPLKIVIPLVALLVLIFLSPLWVLFSILALPVLGVILVVQAVRNRPLATWGILGAGCFALLITSCSAAAVVYGGASEETAEKASAPERTTETQPQEEETTRYVTVEETVERTVETTIANQPEPEPEEEEEQEEEQPVVATTSPEDDEEDDGRTSVTVASVTDGDTLVISEPVEGLTDVRLIGVDTPETYGGSEPYGPEASAFAAEELSGQSVQLELDVETVDPYERLLAYVYTEDGEMFNETLVAEGYAQVATFPPNTRYEGDFLAAQEEARAAGLGIWSLPEEELCQLADRDNGIGGGCEELPVVQPEVAPVPGVDEPPVIEEPPAVEEPPVDPGGGSGVATDGWYPGAPDLDCADFSGPVSVSPGDPFGLDGDGDGIACE